MSSQNSISRVRKRKVISSQRTRSIRRLIRSRIVDPDQPLALLEKRTKVARDTVRRGKAAQTAVHRVDGKVRIVGGKHAKLIGVDATAFIDRSQALGRHGESERG